MSLQERKLIQQGYADMQSGIEEIDNQISREKVNIQMYSDDGDMVDHSKKVIGELEVNKERLKRAIKGLPIEEEVIQKELQSSTIPSFVKDIWRRVYLFATFRAKMEPTVNLFQPVPVQPVEIEAAWFTRANNIMEAAWEDTKIEGSKWNAQRSLWNIEEEYKGFIVLADDINDRDGKRARIDQGDTQGFYTIEVFNQKFNSAPVVDEPLEQYENDIEFLTQKQMPKPDYDKGSTTVQLKLTNNEEQSS